MKEFSTWIINNISTFESLTKTVVSTTKNLLQDAGIDFLSVEGRTKTIDGINEKIIRKSYFNPRKQLTDISGIRIVAFCETDVDKICSILESTFCVDKDNSLNKDDLMKVDQVGYRSVHYVCDLGEHRSSLPENMKFHGLNFEFQIRTILQHAWAELAHDGNYKFSGKLPKHIERQLYLYAGMLEIADKGFDSLTREIDEYSKNVRAEAKEGNFNFDINSISLKEFFDEWVEEEQFPLEYDENSALIDLIEELNLFGLENLDDIKSIIPKDYSAIANKNGFSTTYYGLARDWMIIHDHKRYIDKCWRKKWLNFGHSPWLFNNYLPNNITDEINGTLMHWGAP